MTERSDDSPRTVRVLEYSFIEGLEDLPLDEVRQRRSEARAERDFQSYLRRLVQFRQDVLEAERARRRAGGPPQSLVDQLTSVLSEGPRGGSRGEAVRFTLSAADLSEAERRADEVATDRDLADVGHLDDGQLDEALLDIRQHEEAVSANRAAVIRVHDRLQAELKRRYRDDPSVIPTDL
jgi:hypothetical protein